MTDTLIGIKIGPYEILEKIGVGGMAEVYKGRHVALQRLVAIKFLGRSLQADQGLTQRFRREAQAIAAMRHPNIVQVHDFGNFEGGHYLVMEYVEGTDLRRDIDRRRQKKKPFTPAEILNVIKQIAQALDYAHKQGIIHRDVKPGNILLTKDGQAILGDFGLVMLRDRISQATLGTSFGTPEYIAPEQAMDSRAALPQSDIYALGGIVYEMVTGQLPFEADSALSLALKHISEDPTPPRKFARNLPQGVENAILRALAKEPKQRYDTAQEFVEALRQAWEKAGKTPEAAPAEAFIQSDTIPPPPSKNAPTTKPKRPTNKRPNAQQTPPAKAPATVPQTPSTPAQQTPTAPPPQKRRIWPVLGLLLILLIGGGYAAARMGYLPWPAPLSPTMTATPTKANATATRTVAATTAAATTSVPLTATNTPTLTPTQKPTTQNTPTSTSTPTTTPTPTPTALPTPTATPTATPTPSLIPGQALTREVDSMVVHFVPGGSFLMGAAADDADARKHEQPQHEVTLSPFWIDQTEVTTDQYKLCVAAGDCEAPVTRTAYDNLARGNHPMNYISWEDAAAYCAWVAAETGWDVRLPTEAQWEKAASWDPQTQTKRRYPWGNEFDATRVALSGRTSAVGSFPTGVSAYGALDMAGNAWEWVSDWYDKDYYAVTEFPADPTGPADGQLRVLRGGDFSSTGANKTHLRTSYRETGYPASASSRPAKGPNLGFRCAVNGERLP